MSFKINPAMKSTAIDIAERVFWTFVEAFLGVMMISPVYNVSALHAAAMAGLAAAVTYVKATAATLKGGTLSPASTAASGDPVPLVLQTGPITINPAAPVLSVPVNTAPPAPAVPVVQDGAP